MLSFLAPMLRKLNEWVFRVERTLVVSFLLTMVVIVFVEVADRRLSSQDSKAAAFLLSFPHLVGWHPSAEFVSRFVAPPFLAGLFFLLAWFAQATIRRTRDEPARRAHEAGRAAILTAIVVGMCLLLERAPSNIFYAVLWALVAGGVAIRSRKIAIGVLAVGGAAGLWFVVPDGYSWAKEVAMVLLVWTGFLGASMAAFAAKHIDIDFGPKVFPPRARPYVIAVGRVLNAGFAAFFVVLGIWKTMNSYRIGDELPYPRLPGWIVVAIIPLSFALISLRTLGSVRAALRAEPK
jgi:TRAP-type C4-dicarboxylate transport system permease small subunit